MESHSKKATANRLYQSHKTHATSTLGTGNTHWYIVGEHILSIDADLGRILGQFFSLIGAEIHHVRT